MADLGNMQFSVSLKDMTDADIKKIKDKLEKAGFKINASADRKSLEKNINDILRNRTFKINVEPNKKIKKAAIEVNKSLLINSVTSALKGKTFKANVDVVVKTASVQDAIKQAFAKAGMNYNTTASDVRAQRILEIQQRMALRAAQANNNLNRSYREASIGASQFARATVGLNNGLQSNIRFGGKLGTVLGNLASILSSTNILKDVIRIGGELENQRIALGSILQDGGKATDMFSKIQSLAVKSPFGIMDLNQYVKQLAAYSVPYNELYETMKRLADVSAGVGVDMGRIILAFGQVRAAGFLKGTELRQFTEANIPMVQALADRFSILEKRIVSAGEVYDMISKKKVSFEDVKAVLWELTGEGGRFNNMQEVLSESLASKWKNLSDAIDVMYGKIAEGTIGDWAKNLAEGLTEVTKQWEYVATAIKSAAAAYLVYKNQMNGKQAVLNAPMNNLLASKQKEAEKLRLASLYRNLTSAEEKLLKTTNELNIADMKRAIRVGELNRSMAVRLIQLKQVDAATARYLVKLYAIQKHELQAAVKTNIFRSALTGLWTTIKGVGAALKTMVWNPFTGLFLAFSAVSEIFTYYNKKAEEVKQRNEDVAESAKGSAETLERELLKIKDLDISKMNTDEMKIKVKELTSVIQNEADGWQSILSEIFAKEADGTFKNSVEEQLKLLKTKMDELAEAKKKLMGDEESYSDVIGSTESGWWFFEKDIIDRIKEYSDAVDANDKKLKDLSIHARDVSAALSIATKGNETLEKSLEGKNLNRKIEELKEYEHEWAIFTSELSKTNSDAIRIIDNWTRDFYTFRTNDEMLSDFNHAKNAMIKELTLQGEEIGNLSENGRQYVLGFVDGLIKEATVQKPKVQQYIYDWFTGQFGLPRNDLDYVVPSGITNVGNGGDTGGSKKDAVAELWKKRAEEIDKAVKMYDQWKKLEGTEKARTRVQTKDELANLFSGVYGFKLDLENPTAAYEFIQSKLNKNLSAQKELMVQLGVKISEAEFKDAQDKLKANIELLKREAEKIIQGWDLYKRLFEATGDKKTSMNIAFGKNIGFKDKLTHLRSQIETEMGKIGATIPFEKLIGMDTKDLESKGLGGLSDLIEKYNRENAKLKEESVKNFIDIIEASKDFAAQIEDIERNLEKDLKDLRANANGADTSSAEAQLRKNAAEAISKVNFEEFKQSSDWIRVFDDLNRVSDATLDNMITKIEEFARHGKMSEEVTKQIVDAMAKLRKETIERNPFEGFEDAWKRLKYFKGLRSKVGEYDEHGKLITQQMVDDGIAEANDDLETSSLAVADKFQAVANAANLLSGLFENLGIDLSGISDIFGGAASGAVTGAGLASAFGAAGPWGAIAGAAVGMLSSVFAQHDKALQKEIEASEAREKAIKGMSDMLKTALERNLGGIYTMTLDKSSRDKMNELVTETRKFSVFGVDMGIHRYSEETREKAEDALKENSYYDAQLAALLAQRDELNEQMAAEADKKNGDEAKLADYQQQLEEMKDAIDNFAEDMLKSLYDVDFNSWAEQLSTALVDAWSNGEDAVNAYKNAVNDMLRDVVTSIIQQQIIGKYLEDQLDGILAAFEAKNGVLDKEIFGMLASLAEGLQGKVGDAQDLLEALDKEMEKYGYDLNKLEGGSSGLSKSIQGVTEDTANLLGSYLNSIRHDSSVQRSLIEQLVSVSVPRMSMLAEAQLQQLQMVVANTKRNADAADRIYELVNKVVDKGGNKLRV